MPDNESASGKRDEEKEPSLLFELLAVALSLFKFLFAIVVPLGVIIFVLRNHPAVLMGTIYALLFIGMIVAFGYQNYEWKKKDFERKRREREQDEKSARQVKQPRDNGDR